MAQDAYMNLLNGHAFSVLSKPAEIPDFKLGVGECETLTNIPVILFIDYALENPQPQLGETLKVPYEKLGTVGDGMQVTDVDFRKEDFYIGETLASWGGI